MNIFGEIATEIVDEEFDYLTGSEITSEVSFVSGWLSGHIGDLNILLNQSFSGEDPELAEEEQAIFKDVYMLRYYKKKMHDTLRGIDSSVDWQTIREGDSLVTRTNKNEVAKSWRAAAKDTESLLNEKVAKYNIYEAHPRQVVEYD
jgi:hypothetical protein